MEDNGANLRYTRVSRGHRRHTRTDCSGSAIDVCIDHFVYDFISRPLAVVMRRKRTMTPLRPLDYRYITTTTTPSSSCNDASRYGEKTPHVAHFSNPAFRGPLFKPFTYVTHPQVGCTQYHTCR